MISSQPSPPPASILQLAGLPQVCVLQPLPQPEAVFQRLSHLPGCVFLDSSLRHDSLGRYSFIAADPFQTVKVEVGSPEPLRELRQLLSDFSTERRRDLPPFQGGAAGVFSYELGQSFERLPEATHQEFQIPAIHVGLYDVVISFDHHTKNAWVISHGWPETDPVRRTARAYQRLRFFQSRVMSKNPPPSREPSFQPSMPISSPHFPVDGHDGLYSNFTQAGYEDAVSRTIEHIRAGDIFQANLSQRLLKRATVAAPVIFHNLRNRTKSTYSAYYDGGDFQVMSASPERFLGIDNRHVEARPIKGTRRLTNNPQLDAALAKELQENEKERAENIMIVDLLRNDLSRVCEPHSIRVPQLCAVEKYGYVQHLVSVVTGTLAEDRHPLDAIECAFPGGSVTGCAKEASDGDPGRAGTDGSGSLLRFTRLRRMGWNVGFEHLDSDHHAKGRMVAVSSRRCDYDRQPSQR